MNRDQDEDDQAYEAVPDISASQQVRLEVGQAGDVVSQQHYCDLFDDLCSVHRFGFKRLLVDYKNYHHRPSDEDQKVLSSQGRGKEDDE